MTKRFVLLLGSAVAFISAPCAAAQTDAERLQQLIKQAEAARAEALIALKRADAALAAAQRALENRDAAAPPALEPPPATPATASAAPIVRDQCDDVVGGAPAGQLSTADWMLKAPEASDSGLNQYVVRCLGMTKATQFKNTTDLGIQFTGTKSDGMIDLAVSRTIRRLTGFKNDSDKVSQTFRSSYWKFSVGGFGTTGDDGDTPLYDLTEAEWSSGVGFLLGVEWGRGAKKDRATLTADINKAIATARRECLAYHGVIDPMSMKPEERGGLTEPGRNPDPLASCHGAALVTWMSAKERQSGYWTAIAAPLWGYRADSSEFVGLQARYGFSEYSYYPIKDPLTGAIVTALPTEQKLEVEPFSVKAYAGATRGVDKGPLAGAKYGGGLSLTWRREYSFAKGTKKKQFCKPEEAASTFDLCTTANLAAPYELDGFVLGGSIGGQLPRLWYLPPLALSIRPSYAFDTERFGLEVPFYLVTDSEGKMNSGIRLNCRFKGRTPAGLELEEECGFNIFLGTSIELGK